MNLYISSYRKNTRNGQRTDRGIPAKRNCAGTSIPPSKPPKYISFLPPGRERFVRGSLKSLGKEYTKERISERIAERVQSRDKTLPGAYVSKRLIDTSQEKFQESAGLRRWAEIENFKTAASAYSKVSSTADLEQRIAEQSALSRSVNWRNWSSILVRNEMMNQNIKK